MVVGELGGVPDRDKLVVDLNTTSPTDLQISNSVPPGGPPLSGWAPAGAFVVVRESEIGGIQFDDLGDKPNGATSSGDED